MVEKNNIWRWNDNIILINLDKKITSHYILNNHSRFMQEKKINGS